MLKIKSTFTRMLSLWDILLTWIITKMLDYLIERTRGKVKFEGEVHFFNYLLLKLGQIVEFYSLFVALPYVISFNRPEEVESMRSSQFFTTALTGYLLNHRRLHRYGVLKTKSCKSCGIIAENKDLLQTFVSSPKLYPPFNFLISE